MIYEIRHVTTYKYEGSVAASRCILRLLPRDDGGQTVIDSGLDVAPAPATRKERTDFFGNRVMDVEIKTPHRELRVAALGKIKVARPEPPAAALTPAWEKIRADALATRDLTAVSPAHGLYPSRLAPLYEPATAYARESFRAGRPIMEAADDLMRRIKRDFKYDPAATDVSTPIAEAFAKKTGVCQDFAHIMIAGLRGLGLPALYVSGYIRTIPPPGKERLVGADASHAWASVWCGPDWGWIDFDPTNAKLVSDDHIVVAIGRDYADVSPVDGTIFVSGDQKLEVFVDILPVKE